MLHVVGCDAIQKRFVEVHDGCLHQHHRNDLADRAVFIRPLTLVELTVEFHGTSDVPHLSEAAAVVEPTFAGHDVALPYHSSACRRARKARPLGAGVCGGDLSDEGGARRGRGAVGRCLTGPQHRCVDAQGGPGGSAPAASYGAHQRSTARPPPESPTCRVRATDGPPNQSRQRPVTASALSDRRAFVSPDPWLSPCHNSPRGAVRALHSDVEMSGTAPGGGARG